MTLAKLDIEGMSCGHCLSAVNRALASIPGVEVQSVRLGQAVVRFDESVTDASGLEAAIAGAGYRAKVRS